MIYKDEVKELKQKMDYKEFKQSMTKLKIYFNYAEKSIEQLENLFYSDKNGKSLALECAQTFSDTLSFWIRAMVEDVKNISEIHADMIKNKKGENNEL